MWWYWNSALWKILKISNIIYKRKAFGTKQLSSKFKFFTVGVDFLSSPFVMRKQVQKSHLFTRKILLEIFFTIICVILRDSLPFIQFFRLYPKKFYWKSLDFRKHKCNGSQTKFLLQMKMRGWVTQRAMEALQTSFHSYPFCFQTVNRDVKNLFNSGIPYIQGWLRNVCRGISRKREGMLIKLQSHFKFNFPKKLKLLNLRVWCIDKLNSVAKSFPTVSKRWSRTFFSSSQIKGFETLSSPF